MSLSERIRPNSEAAPWVIDEVARLERELADAYLELRKQRPVIKAVFDRDVWNRAEAADAAGANAVTPEVIKEVLTAIVSRSDAELLSMTHEELKAEWYFEWNPSASDEWNLYKFCDFIELHRNRYRRWEEHHNGSCCVVERVRDTYLMPRIKEFMALLKAHIGLGGK